MRRWICRLFDHRWERLEDTPAHGTWWFENRKCGRCGGFSRQMVASQEG
jgi:hypothetical protein